jgi:hypothetical protein
MDHIESAREVGIGIAFFPQVMETASHDNICPTRFTGSDILPPGFWCENQQLVSSFED